MKTILAIQPNANKVAYAIFRGTDLVANGSKNLDSDKPIAHRVHRIAVPFVEELIHGHAPDIVILPVRTKDTDTARNLFVRAFASHRWHWYEIRTFSRQDVRKAFTSFVGKKASREKIMRQLCIWFPALAEFLPKPRRAWESDRYWAAMFDAISLAITYLHHQ